MRRDRIWQGRLLLGKMDNKDGYTGTTRIEHHLVMSSKLYTFNSHTARAPMIVIVGPHLPPLPPPPPLEALPAALPRAAATAAKCVTEMLPGRHRCC